MHLVWKVPTINGFIFCISICPNGEVWWPLTFNINYIPFHVHPKLNKMKTLHSTANICSKKCSLFTTLLIMSKYTKNTHISIGVKNTTSIHSHSSQNITSGWHPLLEIWVNKKVEKKLPAKSVGSYSLSIYHLFFHPLLFYTSDLPMRYLFTVPMSHPTWY